MTAPAPAPSFQEVREADSFVAHNVRMDGGATGALQAWLDRHDIPARWKAEADAGIALLDSLGGTL